MSAHSTRFQQLCFQTSAAAVNQLPSDQGFEIAIVGRSNAGKSSVLNAISHQRQLARVSRTPGRTQLLNVFTLGEGSDRRLIDLPGYGYAKVPRAEKGRWETLIGEYLRERQSLKGLILVTDCRHPTHTMDEAFLSWVSSAQLPLCILLNKVDKLKYEASQKALRQGQAQWAALDAHVQLFSATEGTGLESLAQVLKGWWGLS